MNRMTLRHLPLALGALLVCTSPLGRAELSISIGLTPYGYAPYPGPVSVYPPGPVYYPPPVIYLGHGRWGHDDDDDRGPPEARPRPRPRPGPNSGHDQGRDPGRDRHPEPGRPGAGGPHNGGPHPNGARP